MPRRNRNTRRPRGHWYEQPRPETPDPTPWRLAVQLVKAGKAPVDILRGGGGDR